MLCAILYQSGSFFVWILRSFIAIELPGTIRAALADLQQELKGCGADVRWVDPANIHLTLKFFGDIKEETAEEIIRLMQRTCHNHDPLNLEIKGVGMFPGPGSPRVLWVGIDSNDALADLHKELENKMSSLGFESEKRRFTPHLTLGRFRSLKGKECLLEKIRLREKDSLVPMHIRSLSLMKSELDPAGARHTKIGGASLDKSARNI
ncbi:MAG TPA: RNA 2',3'-cyclic phosphodiesterase [Nitrospirae bacterium]|nr:RNA 2',3'-cyclic phosphodiesterase [Nitrospirota bacterium]HDK41427.1 RNA 2',3'-cyclic phosphodiesterase [Nitrospirota bacterium]